MQKKRLGMLGIGMLAMLFFGGSSLVLADEPVSNEEYEVISMDGVYSAGGFDYSVDEDDFEEAESEIDINNWESDGTGTNTTFSSAEEAMASAFDKYETIVEFPTGEDAAYRVAKADVEALVNGFLNTHPQYFYIDKISYVSASGYVRRLIITYTDNPENLQVMRGKYELALQEAFREVDASVMSPEDICVVLHDYLVNHITYNDDESLTYRYTAYGAIVEGQAVCQGYALAYQELLKMAGISAITVGSDSMRHAWNMVKLDDLYYHVDVTWDDTATMPGQVRHKNVLLSRNAIEANGHTGYAVSDAIYNGTGTTYDQYYWINVQSAIYYYNQALYYLYPTDIEGANIDKDALTATHQLLFVKKPLAEASPNVNLMQYVYANVAINQEEITEANKADGVKRLESAYNRIRNYGYLAKSWDTWYFNTAYGIYEIDMEAADAAMASVSADAVHRWADTDDAVYGLTTVPNKPFLVGLIRQGNTLYYKTDGGTLLPVPELSLTMPEADKLFLYQSGREITLSLEEKYQIVASTLPTCLGETLVYAVETTEEPSPIGVSSTGLVTANAYSKAPVKVVVKNATGELVDYLYISVKNTAPEKLLISNTSLKRAPGEEKQLTVTVLPGNASDKELAYVSYDEKVATVDQNGLIKAVGVGETQIKVFMKNYPDIEPVYCYIKVQILPTAIQLSQSTMALETGATGKLTYSLLPANTSETGVTWSSSNKKVATVAADGTVTAKGAGEATITVKSTADTSVKATCKVTVTDTVKETPPEEPTNEPVDVTGIKLNVDAITMTMTSTKKVQATLYPSNATIQGIIWSSSDRNVLTVKSASTTSSLQAIITPEGVGTAQVTATTVDGAFVARVKVTVNQKSIAKATVGKIANKSYTGKAIKPSPAIKINGKKLVKNQDYKITYKNNKQVGTATVIFKGIGNFKGTKKVTFKIIPRMPKVTLGKKTKNSIQIAIGKISEAEGYQIIYATNKTFTKNKKTVFVKGNKASIQTLKKLKAKTKYYIKVRAYKKVKGKKVYSNEVVLSVKTASK